MQYLWTVQYDVLTNQFTNKKSVVIVFLYVQGKPDLYYEMLSLKQSVFIWDCKGGHTILELKPENIVYITPHHMAIEPERIINDWKKRQAARFRYVG